MSSYETTQNVPEEVLEAVRKQELEKTKEGILKGIVSDENRSKPKPERVTDIRMGRGVL